MSVADPERLDAALALHHALLTKWRGAMDLVGPGPIEPHFEDARGSIDDLPLSGQWVDLGSGAGFPGVALAAANPGARVWLVESRLKRAGFLERVVREARLENAGVVNDRTESLSDASFDGVISRAYKPLDAYLQDAARLLRQGGLAVCLVGSERTPTLPTGWTLSSEHRYPVEDGSRRRLVLQYGHAAPR